MKIAVIGDLHYPSMEEYSPQLKEARDYFFTTFLKRFFEIEADLYVSVGDLTNYSTPDELTEVFEIINGHNKKFVHVIGNHDSYGLPKEQMTAISKQSRYSSLQFDTIKLIFIDTAKEQNFQHWGGTLDEEQLQWLGHELETDQNVIVFAHHPVYNTTTGSSKDCLSVDPAIPLSELLSKKSGHNLYVNGHNHFNSIHQDASWSYVQIAAVMDEIGARLIEINEDAISITEVPLYSEELRNYANEIGTAINHFKLCPDQLATEKERNLQIPTKQTIQVI